jgi:hypothetical protein
MLPSVFSQEDLSHPTLAQSFQDAIVSNYVGRIAAVIRCIRVVFAGHGWQRYSRQTVTLQNVLAIAGL